MATVKMIISQDDNGTMALWHKDHVPKKMGTCWVGVRGDNYVEFANEEIDGLTDLNMTPSVLRLVNVDIDGIDQCSLKFIEKGSEN